MHARFNLEEYSKAVRTYYWSSVLTMKFNILFPWFRSISVHCRWIHFSIASLWMIWLCHDGSNTLGFCMMQHNFRSIIAMQHLGRMGIANSLTEARSWKFLPKVIQQNNFNLIKVEIGFFFFFFFVGKIWIYSPLNKLSNFTKNAFIRYLNHKIWSI